jgi:hypothetical protein
MWVWVWVLVWVGDSLTLFEHVYTIFAPQGRAMARVLCGHCKAAHAGGAAAVILHNQGSAFFHFPAEMLLGG